MSGHGWYGVDLDGTLAQYDGWKGADQIGDPIPEMVGRVKAWLAEGKDVRIFTARVSHNNTKEAMLTAQLAMVVIMDWVMEHIGQPLPITCVKDYGMLALYDDRCVQVETNTGRLIEAAPAGPVTP